MLDSFGFLQLKEMQWRERTRSLWLLNVFLVDNIGVNSGTIMDI
jgi:hypothetical protein